MLPVIGLISAPGGQKLLWNVLPAIRWHVRLQFVGRQKNCKRIEHTRPRVSSVSSFLLVYFSYFSKYRIKGACKQNIHKLSKIWKVVAKLSQNDRKVVPKFSQSFPKAVYIVLHLRRMFPKKTLLMIRMFLWHFWTPYEEMKSPLKGNEDYLIRNMKIAL